MRSRKTRGAIEFVLCALLMPKWSLTTECPEGRLDHFYVGPREERLTLKKAYNPPNLGLIRLGLRHRFN